MWQARRPVAGRRRQRTSVDAAVAGQPRARGSSAIRSGRRAAVLTSRTSRVGARSTSRCLSASSVEDEGLADQAAFVGADVAAVRPSRRKPASARACRAAVRGRAVDDGGEPHSASSRSRRQASNRDARLVARRVAVDDGAAAAAIDRLEPGQGAGSRVAARRPRRRPGRSARERRRRARRAARAGRAGSARAGATRPRCRRPARRGRAASGAAARRRSRRPRAAGRRRPARPRSPGVRQGQPSASATRNGTVPPSPGPLRQPSSTRSL